MRAEATPKKILTGRMMDDMTSDYFFCCNCGIDRCTIHDERFTAQGDSYFICERCEQADRRELQQDYYDNLDEANGPRE